MIMVTPCVPVSAGRMPEKREHPSAVNKPAAGLEETGMFREVFLQEYARISGKAALRGAEGAGGTPCPEKVPWEESEPDL